MQVQIKVLPLASLLTFTALTSVAFAQTPKEITAHDSSKTLIETCIAYPANKKSGDSFELDAPSGYLTVQIR